MPNMKFQVESAEHSSQIQRALFRLGYRWNSRDGDKVFETSAPFLYATDYPGAGKLITYGHSVATFDRKKCDEYIYRLALVEPRDGRPIQQVPPPVLDTEDPNDMHAHVPDPKPYLVKVETLDGNVSYLSAQPAPPLGVKPRPIADRLYHISRGLELAAAINRYTNAQLVVPLEWMAEYNERVEEIRKLEKSA